MKALSWNELAEEYNKHTTGKAYTKSMDTVFDWACKRTDLFELKNGKLYKMTQRTVKAKSTNDSDIVNDGDKVWVTITRNVNLGNFENYKLEAGYSRTIKHGEVPMDLMREMEAEIQPFVNKQARILKKKHKRMEE
jgi:hypothetical protein